LTSPKSLTRCVVHGCWALKDKRFEFELEVCTSGVDVGRWERYPTISAFYLLLPVIPNPLAVLAQVQ
jgi:hypothetical protein